MFHALEKHILENWDTFGNGCKKPQKLEPIIYHGSKVTTFLLFPNTTTIPLLVAKVARSHASMKLLQQEYEHTTRVQRVFSHEGYPTAPCPLFLGNLDNRSILIQSMVPGYRLTTLSTTNFSTFSAARDWLIKFHIHTRKATVFDDTQLVRYFLDPIQKFSTYSTLSRKGRVYLDMLTARVYTLYGTKFPLVFLHGDYSVSNILFYRKRIAVIDWSQSQERGLPLIDLYHCALSYAKLLHHIPFRERMRYTLFENNVFAQFIQKSFELYCNAVGIERTLIPFLISFHFMRQIARSDTPLLHKRKAKFIECYNDFAHLCLKKKLL